MSPTLRTFSGKVFACVISCVGLLTAGIAIGQQQKMAAPAAKTPLISSVFPAGGQRGAAAEISVKGKNLNTVTDLYFSRPVGTIEKIEAKGADQLVATVAIDKDVEPGTFELRAVSGDGMSNLKLFRVDEFPEIAETAEKNDTPAQAQEIKFPSVVNGQLAAADVDYYRFEVKEKQRIVFEIEARRLGSPVEARLRLHDGTGRLLADAATTRAIRPDERLDYEFTVPGTYIVAVEDAQYAGGDAAVYRLRVGSWPYATAMFPLGGRRGESIEVTLEGGNLEGPAKHKVELPTDPQITMLRPQFPSERGTLVAPMLLVIGNESEVMETEPNDDPKQPQAIQSPCAVNGRIARPGDKDRFVLTAKKGEKILVEVFADRLGSWLDSVLTVTDKNGRQIVENDDLRPGNQQQNAQIKTGNTPISDSRAEFTAGADGEYIITIDDRYNSGGPEFAYRLVATPSRPDFLLAYGPAPAQKNQPAPKTPQPPTPTDLVNLEPGKSVVVAVAVTRRGYDGEIALSVEGLPEHVAFEPGKVAAKLAAGQVTIKADAEAATHIGRARVVGTAKIADQQVKRSAQTEIIVAQFDQNDRLHVARLEMADLALAVIRRETPLVLKVDGEAVLACGLETELKIGIDRRGGLKGSVEIKLDKLPKGVTAEKITIAENENEGVVKLKSEAGTAIAKQKIQVIAQGKLGAAAVETPPAEVALAIVPPFELALDPKEKQLELVIGEACTLKVAVKRQGNFDGPIELTVTGLPGGVSVTPDKVEPDQEEVELNFVVSDEAKPNKSKKPIKIQATGEIGKQKVKFETAAINVTVKKAE